MASPYAAADNTRLHVELRQAEQRWRRWQPAPRDVQPYVMPSVGTSAYVAARQTAGGADLLGGLTRYFGAATRTPTAVYADVPSPEPARPQTRASLRPPDARTAAGRRKHDEARRGYAGALRARRTPGTSTVAHSPAMRAASPHDHLPPMTPGGFTPGVSAVSSRAASIAPSPAASEWQHALAAPSPRVPASSAAAAATGHTDGDEYFFRIETASPIASGHFGAVWRVLRMRRPGRRLATGMRPPDEVVGTHCLKSIRFDAHPLGGFQLHNDVHAELVDDAVKEGEMWARLQRERTIDVTARNFALARPMPNIVRLENWIVEDTHALYLMPLYPQTLTKLIDSARDHTGGGLPWRLGSILLCEVTDALAFVHLRDGMSHEDVKTDNIMVSIEPEAFKLLLDARFPNGGKMDLLVRSRTFQTDADGLFVLGPSAFLADMSTVKRPCRKGNGPVPERSRINVHFRGPSTEQQRRWFERRVCIATPECGPNRPIRTPRHLRNPGERSLLRSHAEDVSHDVWRYGQPTDAFQLGITILTVLTGHDAFKAELDRAPALIINETSANHRHFNLSETGLPAVMRQMFDRAKGDARYAAEPSDTVDPWATTGHFRLGVHLAQKLTAIELKDRLGVGFALDHPYFITAHQDLALRAWSFALAGKKVLERLPAQAPERHSREPVIQLLVKVHVHLTHAIEGFLNYAEVLEELAPDDFEPHTWIASVVSAIRFINHWDGQTWRQGGLIRQEGPRDAEALSRVTEGIASETGHLFKILQGRLMAALLAIDGRDRYDELKRKREAKHTLVGQVLNALGSADRNAQAERCWSPAYTDAFDVLAKLENKSARGRAEVKARAAVQGRLPT